ncbi:hypothetical protein BJ508DRAFT_333537 [Ascobolus immersus RN42]|uniref:Uncharacterized protein n=1 Tax=Ascobolus immersus RN42 TaxID=1160509 RepID=A0A3N4HQ95_ASCIM|nr:hypothetical protein BJ508DRAFT_333537 [Ascobolus immersus RN42]
MAESIKQCVFSLFALTHTCHTLYTEINNRKRLVKQSAGFEAFASKPSTDLTAHSMLPKGTLPLTIPMMQYKDQLEHFRIDSESGLRVPSWEEVDAFNGSYGSETGWWCCHDCGFIKQRIDIPSEKRYGYVPSGQQYCRRCRYEDPDLKAQL